MAFVAVLSVVVLFLAPVGADAAQPQCPHFEVEAIDTDMAGAILAEKASDTSDGCCPLCEEVDGCEGFAYLNQVCYLKGNFSGTFFQTGVVSRVKRALGAGCPGFQAAEQGKDLVGDLLDDWSAANPEVCCAACAEKSDCQGFAFFDGRCYLKANVRGMYVHTGCIGSRVNGCMVRVKEGVLSEIDHSKPEQPQCPHFEMQVADTDLAGALLGARGAASSDECCPFCEELDGCEGFAYFEEVCYLKGSLSGTFQKAGVFSRIKRALGAGCPGFKAAEQGKDLVGDLLEGWSAPHPEVCCAACAEKSECQGFAFLDGQCFLKANVRGTYGHDGCMVRVKEGVMSEVGSTPEPAQSQCPDFEEQALDIDMAGVLLAAKSAATSDGCCTFCEDEVGCEGFAYFEQVCYLKGNFSGTFSKVGVVSRIRKGVGTSCPGFAAQQNNTDLAGDLVDIWSAPQAEHCCAACAMRPDCQGFAFFEGNCFLKGNVQGTYDHSGCMVQTKEGVLSEEGGGRRLAGMPLLV